MPKKLQSWSENDLQRALRKERRAKKTANFAQRQFERTVNAHIENYVRHGPPAPRAYKEQGPRPRTITVNLSETDKRRLQRMGKSDYGPYIDADTGKTGYSTAPNAKGNRVKVPFGSALRLGKGLLEATPTNNPFFDLGEEVWGLFRPFYDSSNNLLRWPLNNGGQGFWMKNGLHTAQSGTYPTRPDNIYSSLQSYHIFIGGQSIAVHGRADSTTVPTHWSDFGWWRRNTSPTVTRYANYARFGQWQLSTGWRLNTAGHNITHALRPASPFNPAPVINPNQMRRAPALHLVPIPAPVDSPAVRGSSKIDPRSYERTMVISNAAPSSRLPPIIPHKPVPTRPGEQESKGTSRTRDLGKRLADSLDKVSEAAEVVDAVYEALPDDVKKRWACGKSKQSGLDGRQDGQYGLGSSDCQLRALWHNWHKLDLNEAVKNILANEIEDRLYGSAFAARDNLRPRAHLRERKSRRK